MRALIIALAAFAASGIATAQTCTISGTVPSTVNWVNPGPSCLEGGNAGSKATLVIPSGITLVFDDVADTWSGTMIKVFGTLKINADVTINSSVDVYSGGVVDLGAKLSLGTAVPGCNYSFNVRSGGLADTGNASDRLYICGNYLVKGGGGGCNSCGGTNSGQCAYNGSTPYCSPAAGFTGPIGFTKNGYNGTLPVKLIYFKGQLENSHTLLSWSTSMQKDFDYFAIQRSSDGVTFDSLGNVRGEGKNVFDIESKYSFTDEHPVIGTNYYRLKAVDLDRTVEYFTVVAVNFTGNKMVWIEPNPTTGNAIQLKGNFNFDESDKVLVLSNLGVEIKDFTFSPNEKRIEFNTPLNPGVYIIKYITTETELAARALVR